MAISALHRHFILKTANLQTSIQQPDSKNVQGQTGTSADKALNDRNKNLNNTQKFKINENDGRSFIIHRTNESMPNYLAPPSATKNDPSRIYFPKTKGTPGRPFSAEDAILWEYMKAHNSGTPISMQEARNRAMQRITRENLPWTAAMTHETSNQLRQDLDPVLREHMGFGYNLTSADALNNRIAALPGAQGDILVGDMGGSQDLQNILSKPENQAKLQAAVDVGIAGNLENMSAMEKLNLIMGEGSINPFENLDPNSPYAKAWQTAQNDPILSQVANKHISGAIDTARHTMGWGERLKLLISLFLPELASFFGMDSAGERAGQYARNYAQSLIRKPSQ